MSLKTYIKEEVIKDNLYSLEAEMLSMKEGLFLQLVSEGVYDPGILKCVFMAGGPASGKSYQAKDIFGIGKGLSSVSATGLKTVNSDSAFEAGLKKHGISPKDLARIEKEDSELWDKITKVPGGIRDKAKKLTATQKKFYEAGRLGMIIDGTGDDYNKIKKQKLKAEKLGYDCYMVFVNTSLKVALERNANRERVLPEDLVKESWKECQENLGKFLSMFGGNFRVIDNTVYKPVTKSIQKAANAFVRKPIKNKIGVKWVENAKALKKSGHIKK